MSGLFERIARRRATPPDETREVDPSAIGASAPPGGGETAPTDAPPTDGADVATPDGAAAEQPTVQSEALDTGHTPEPPAGEAAAEGETAELAADHAAAAGQTPELPAGEAAAEGQTAELPAGEATAEGETAELPAGEAPAAAEASAEDGEASDGASETAAAAAPSFRERGRVRRRLRYLRRVRELQLRDLGGLVFELGRFGRQREDLVSEKVHQLAATDDELRNLETVLDDRRALVELREPGVGGTCPTCGALHGSADRFCSQCGRPLGERETEPAEATAPPAAQPNGGAPGAAADSPHEGSHVA